MAAPTIDNTGQTGVGSAQSSVTITSFAVGSGSNRLLFVGVSYFTATSGRRVSGITFNGNALTNKDVNAISAFGGDAVAEIWFMKEASLSTVTANIVVTFTATVDEIIVGATSWFGVDQTTPFGTIAKSVTTSGSNDPGVTVTSTTDAVVHDVFWGGDNGAAEVATGTQRWQTVNSGFASRGGAQTKPGAASVSMTWTGAHLSGAVSMGIGINGATGGTTFTQSLTAGLTFSGGVTKRTNKSLTAASITPAGAIAKQVNKILVGAGITPTGAIVKQVNKILVGAGITPAGSLAKGVLFSQGMTAALTFTGSTIKQTGKGLSAGLTFAGSTIKTTSKFLAGTITPAGSLQESFTVAKSLVGASLSFVGSVVPQFIPFVMSLRNYLGLSLAAHAARGGMMRLRRKRYQAGHTSR